MKNEKTVINFEYEGEKFTLEYTADSLKKLEKMGLKITQLGDIPLTATEELFIGAFNANHSGVSRKRRKEIFDEIMGESEDEKALLDVLIEMVTEAIDEITSHKGNLKWTVGTKH